MDSEDPDRVTRLAADVAQIRLPVSRWLARLAGVPPDMIDDLEVAVRQYLLSRLLYPNLQPGILLALNGDSAAIAVPRDWQRFLDARGARSNGFGRPLFAGYVVIHWGRGVVAAVRALLAPKATESFRNRDILIGFPPAMQPRAGNSETSNIILRYAALVGPGEVMVEGRESAVEGIAAVNDALPAPDTAWGRVALLFQSIRAALVALVAAAGGQWQLALGLRDIVELKQIQMLKPRQIARAYVFNNSSWVHRRLYTVWAERHAGSSARLLFYSTGVGACQRLASRPTRPTFLPGYAIMTWSNYLVWDVAQADLVAAWGHDRGRARVIGPVPLTDSGAVIGPLPPRSVAVFDVTPHNPTRLAAAGIISFYYTTAAVEFLEKVHSAIRLHGGTMVIKQKRDVGTMAAAPYRRTLARLAAEPDVILLDPGIGAARLVAATDATISLPFTSPAHFASAAQRPSAFFDPSGELLVSEQQSHGLKVIQSREELEAWLGEAFSGRAAPSRTLEPSET
jgi:hypothetical protein